MFIREPAWPGYGLDVVAPGSRDRHPPILPTEWKSNGRLHLQTRREHHTTTQRNLKSRGTLYAQHILSQDSSPTASPSPSSQSPPLASWQEWRHCRWTNRFQLRSHSGCLIWGKSRCARQKAGAPFVYEFCDHLGDAVSFFFSERRERATLANLRHKINHIYSPFFFSSLALTHICFGYRGNL